MSDQIEDGGSAFPTTPENKTRMNGVGGNGMTLRDWFAGQAIGSAWDACDKGYFDGDQEEIAKCAYQIADAMLKAREAQS